MEKITGGATIIDVARKAGVSPSTVTHTLNGKRPVSKEKKDRILAVIDELGYVPSWHASRLKQENSGIIGCYVTDITETFVNQIVKGIEKGLVGSGLSLLFVTGVEFNNDFGKAMEFLKQHSIAGLLYCHHLSLPGYEESLSIEAKRMPVITLNVTIEGVASIVPDLYYGGFQAAEHLYVSGMRRPAFIAGPESRQSVRERIKGFASRLTELGLSLPPETIIYGDYSFDHGYAAMAELLAGNVHPDGVFCANDFIAAGAMTCLQEREIMVPEQVRVVGYDNRDFSRFWPIPITTFQQPLQDMGFMGISLLRGAIDSQTFPGAERHVLQAYLIPRTSTTGAPATTVRHSERL